MQREEVIEKLKKNQGEQSMRSYASTLGCSAAYISDVYAGKRDPGPLLLDTLGLECKVEITKTYQKRRWR
jgi:hypothetical protein